MAKTKSKLDEWECISKDVCLTKRDVAFILSAINNYDGRGETRDRAVAKLRVFFDTEELAYIRKIWGKS